MQNVPTCTTFSGAQSRNVGRRPVLQKGPKYNVQLFGLYKASATGVYYTLNVLGLAAGNDPSVSACVFLTVE